MTEQAIGALDKVDTLPSRESLPGPETREDDPTHAPVRPGLDAIYDAESSRVWNLLRRLGVAPKDQEDVLHDVFLVVHKQLPAYDPQRPLSPWVSGIAVRVAANYRRRGAQSREVLDMDPDLRADEGPDVEQLASRHEAQLLVRRALTQLDDPQRCVLVLHDVEGHAMPDIARELEVPLNTLYSRLRLARARFATLVKRLSKPGGRR